MTVPASPRRRRIRRAAALVAAGAVAVPAAAFAIPTISGSDGVVINPAAQSPDLTIDGVGSIFWSISGTGLGGIDAAPVSIELNGVADGAYTLQTSDEEGAASRTFTVDGTPPTGSISGPVRTAAQNPAITATATDPSGPVTDYAVVVGPGAPASYQSGAPTSVFLPNDGPHEVHLWARDAVGNAGEVGSTTITLDRQAPVVTFTTPSQGARYDIGQTVPADYGCADGAPVAACDGTVAKGTPIDTATAGEKTFTVVATDGLGNSRPQSVTYTVADDSAPTVTVASPKAQKYEVNTLQLASFTCEDNAPGVTCQATAANGDPLDTATLGPHVFTVQAVDTSGNTTTKQVTYQVVDTISPTAPGLVSPPDDTVTNQMRPKLTWTAAKDNGPGGAPGSGIDGYDVLVDGKVVATVGATVTAWTPADDMKSGNHTWRVRARDKAGNDTSSDVFKFRVDPNATAAPVFTAAPPAATNDNTPSFAWTGAEGVQEYRWALKQGAETVADGLLDASSPALDLEPLKDGDYVFTVTQRTNGIHGTAAAHPFTVDTVPPGALTIVVRPAASSDDTTPLFAWAGGEDGARYVWQLSGPGGVIVQGPTETALNAALLTVAPGAYVFQVRQVDAAGNPSPLTVPEPFTVVGGAPPGTGGTTTIPVEPKVPDPVIKPPKKTVKQVRPAPATRNARALTPKAGARITSVRPVLRWKARRGASLYNVQIFRLKGRKLTKVVTAFPRGATYRVPRGKLKAGFRYVWRVWPYVNRRFPNQPLGISYFDVTQSAKALKRSRLLAPKKSAARAGKPLTVRWRARSGSAAYKVQVLRGAKVAFEQVATERTVTVPASAMRKGSVKIRILASKGASQTAFAGSAWAQADLRIR
jgi:hypothetical protein